MLDSIKDDIIKMVEINAVNKINFKEFVDSLLIMLNQNRLGDIGHAEVCPMNGSFSAAGGYPDIEYDIQGNRYHTIHFALRVSMHIVTDSGGTTVMVRIPLTYDVTTNKQTTIGRYLGEVRYDLNCGYASVLDDIMVQVKTNIEYHSNDKNKVWVYVG